MGLFVKIAKSGDIQPSQGRMEWQFEDCASEAVINLDLKQQTTGVLKTLTPREEKVIKMRFGLEDGSERTLEEVGQSFDLKEHVSPSSVPNP